MSECIAWMGFYYRGYDYYSYVAYGKRRRAAHRVVYEQHKGKIPKGLVVHHLCNNKWCVNPDHLEVSTNEANIKRGNGYYAMNSKKTYCVNGHAFTEANTRLGQRGNLKTRGCRICSTITARKWRKLNPDKWREVWKRHEAKIRSVGKNENI